jgi:DNA-binding MarR family transcriptional regulator
MPKATGVLPELGCACATIRRAARLVTQLYSDEMSQKLEPTQFSLLSALSQEPGANQARLGRALGLDKTTMSRSLRLMETHGWIEPGTTADQRERGFQLTPLGRKLFRETKPRWQQAQAKLGGALKPGELEDLLRAVNRMAEAALAAQQAEG